MYCKFNITTLRNASTRPGWFPSLARALAAEEAAVGVLQSRERRAGSASPATATNPRGGPAPPKPAAPIASAVPTLIDIGANVGMMSLAGAVFAEKLVHAQRVLQRGGGDGSGEEKTPGLELFAFEPFAPNYRRLHRTLFHYNRSLLRNNAFNATASNRHVFPIALANEEMSGRELELALWDGNTAGARVQWEAKGEVGASAEVTAEGGAAPEQPATDRVKITTLDRIFGYEGENSSREILRETRSVVLKLDTEGSECAAILGAEKFLADTRHNKVRGLVMEYSGNRMVIQKGDDDVQSVSCGHEGTQEKVVKVLESATLQKVFVFDDLWKSVVWEGAVGKVFGEFLQGTAPERGEEKKQKNYNVVAVPEGGSAAGWLLGNEVAHIF